MGVAPISFDELIWTHVGGGVHLSPLRVEPGGAGAAVLRFEPGAVSPPHRHPGGEDLYVIHGRLRVGDVVLEARDFLHTPPGGVHDAEAYEESLVLISVPEPVEFLA
jgi:quercetin dioxygenase-like cupin family protein